MTRPILVLRPQPGNEATARRIEARGGTAIRLPLFAVRALDWTVPDPADHDALILTSANAIRHAGPQLERLRALPVWAVGRATAEAVREAGFEAVRQGEGGMDALADVARAAGVRRALHLAGREHHAGAPDIVTATRIVYASEPLPVAAAMAAGLGECVALLHSARAGAALAALPGIDRAAIRLAAISEPAARAAGEGWRSVDIAMHPRDPDLIDLALRLAD